MLKITTEALEMLAFSLDASEIPGEKALRLARNPYGNLGLKLDLWHDGDEVVMQGERPVLLLDEGLSMTLSGATLDIVQSVGGDPHLALRMPAE